MSEALTIAVTGANGRMGRMLVEAVTNAENVQLVGATVREGERVVGMDAGELAGCGQIGINLVDGLDKLPTKPDVIIDFTVPEATLSHAAWCAQQGVKLVVGTTGFSQEQLAQLAQLAEQQPIVVAPNMSVAVNVMFKLLAETARVMGEQTDIEILEAHHRFKKDAPSGTALKMGQIIASELDRDLDKCAVYGREGMTGERDPETIGFATVRAGGIVGEHTAMFADLNERLEITHISNSRSTYATGALRAANWLKDKRKGFFDMQDVLGLRD